MTHQKRILSILAIAAGLFLHVENSAAQITQGNYQLVGSMRNGGGFDGKVSISETQAAGLQEVVVRLTNGFVLRGTIRDGAFIVSQVRRGPVLLRANGTVTMRGPDHAIGSVTVARQGRGVMMLGRL
jgi:hypothetical protein